MNVARHLKMEMHYKSQGDGAQRVEREIFQSVLR